MHWELATHQAKLASYLAGALGLLRACSNMLFIFTFRHIIPSFFTTDIDLIGISKDLIVIVGCWQLGDASYGISWGILCAIGKPAIAAQLNFISFFIVGIPLVYLLGPTLGMGTE